MLGKSLFWEAVVSELDMEVHAMYIVPRVMDYGTLEDAHFFSPSCQRRLASSSFAFLQLAHSQRQQKTWNPAKAGMT
jgi:hypothetical protein